MPLDTVSPDRRSPHLAALDYDADLRSVQQARRLAQASRDAQREFAFATQEEVDRVCLAMADAAHAAASRLGRMAHEESGYGVAAHKLLKDQFASRAVWESIADVPTVGVLAHDEQRRITEIAWPVGVVAALTPSTNPTSTPIFKILIAVKARNGIVVAPHPSAAESAAEAVRVMVEAGEAAGMPRGLVSCLTSPTIEGSQALMGHWAVSMILATGGPGMVRAAHSVGKPALGVGPGNVPVYVDRSADVDRAAADIVNSKAFDCSVICSTEQTVVADAPIAARLRRAMQAEGAHWLDDADRAAIERALFTADGAIVAGAVGKTPQQLAAIAGIDVPRSARVLVADLHGVGAAHPLSREKLTTVLGFMVEDGWQAACERSVELLHFGGDGHSLVIHAEDPDVVLAFGLEKPAFRIIVNTWGSMGAIGATTGLAPSLTLAPGGLGGAVVGDNITVSHLFHRKRVAHGIRQPPGGATALPPDVQRQPSDGQPPAGTTVSADEVHEIVRRVMDQLARQRTGGRP